MSEWKISYQFVVLVPGGQRLSILNM